MSDDRYELFCLADRFFYDAAGRAGVAETDYAACSRPVPEGWEHDAGDTWTGYAPSSATLPAQGWKIHVSARVADAERVLDVVWDYCVRRGLAFKFLRSEAVLVMLNSKAALRGSSGKLVTIYPPDVPTLERVLAELDELLSGVVGPYALSDLRYGDGPLFVRYGGFLPRHCVAENGERVLAIEDGEGRLVPDVRGPTFSVPPWVELPGFLAPHLAARNAVTTSGLPYAIESVLQFSNGGGVYLGRDVRSGSRVVLKEGRPHAGLDAAGRDAVTRLTHERDILQRLQGLDVVPAALDYFTLGDHHFLVEEFVDGNPLQRLIVHRYPLSHPDPTPADLVGYVDWALGMAARVERAVQALHARGVVFGDLHPENILVSAEQDRLVLVDFEVASLAGARARAYLANPAFAAPGDRLGVEVDRYALACLQLGLFAPQTTIMLGLAPGKVEHLAELVAETFPVSSTVFEPAVRTIAGDAPVSGVGDLPMPGRAPWGRLREALCAAILDSATPDRDDRLFPGDVRQFEPGGGINLAHGAAGVLHTLAVTGAGRFPQHEDWLRKHALSPSDGNPVGFYDGLHGVAYALEELGHRQDALATLEQGLRAPMDTQELNLHSGLAGIGLNLLHLGARTGERALADLAGQVIDVAADRLGGPEDVPEISGGSNPRAGLMYGSSGPALLFLHAYEQTGDTALLDRAEVGLRQDLRRCVRADDGTLQVNQDWRTLPYLDEGSIGIALVLARYLAHRPDEELAAALDGLRAVTRCGYFVQSGLFAGRSGMIAAARLLARLDGTAAARPEATTAALVRGLRWHALPHGGGLAFPGDQLLRLSMDLATGTAGVLLALGVALHDEPVVLPFLASPRVPVPAGTGNPTASGRR